MDSFYLLNQRNEVFLEHNWRARSMRSVVDKFVLEKSSYAALEKDLAPVLIISRCLVFHLVTGAVTLVCVATKEIDAAFVLEFLHRIASIFEEYFGLAGATTELLINNLDTVTELLCEIVDNGSALTTESNGVRDIVLPPSILNKLINVTGMQSKFESQGQLSSIPWRRAKVKYTNNEIFVDVKEELHATVDKQGKFASTSIAGLIHCTTKLSGTPEVLIDLKPAKVIEFPLLHPSVSRAKFGEKSGHLSFIPPDGPFTLMTYSSELSTTSSSPVPFSVQFIPGRGDDSFDVILSTRSGTPDTVAIEIPLPASCRSVRLAPTRGDASLARSRDESSAATVRWLVSGSSSSKGSITNKSVLSCSNVPKGIRDATHARLVATLPTSAISGLKVESLKMQRVGDWRPYKGVKYVTKVDMIFRAR